jgi:enoyl-CoA hydratase/carnithine racemase
MILDDYVTRYPHARLERHEGVLLVTLHTDGGSLRWNSPVHGELPGLFEDISSDRGNRVVILTGAGQDFIREIEPMELPEEERDTTQRAQKYTRYPVHAERWDRTYWEGKHLLRNLLDIEVPVIAAVNGPAHIHAELALLSDIVLASTTASFRDAPHLPHGVVPGDGGQVIWPLLLGPNRGRYFLLTSQTLCADEALKLGLVSEVHGPSELLTRARELADELKKLPLLTLRYTRVVLTQQIKRMVFEDVGYGLALEGLAAAAGRGREKL